MGLPWFVVVLGFSALVTIASSGRGFLPRMGAHLLASRCPRVYPPARFPGRVLTACYCRTALAQCIRVCFSVGGLRPPACADPYRISCVQAGGLPDGPNPLSASAHLLPSAPRGGLPTTPFRAFRPVAVRLSSGGGYSVYSPESASWRASEMAASLADGP